MSILEKAQSLGEEIVQSSEYEKLKNAEQAMYDDNQASELLNEFSAKQRRLQMAQTNGKQINEKEQNELQSLYTKMQNNKKIKDYQEAQQIFNKVMESVNQIISGTLSGNKTPAEES